MGEDKARQELSSSRGLGRRVAALLVVALGLLAWRAYLTPVWEWDLLGYLGCVEELKGASPEEGHAAAYAALAGAAPEHAVAELRGEPRDPGADPRGSVPYRRKLAEDPRAFDAQLPFYRGRVVYLGSLRAAQALGLSTVTAVRAISILSGLAFGVLLALWIARYLPGLAALLLALAGLGWSGVGEAMSLATPDALAAVLVFGGAYVLVATPRQALGIGLLVLGVATRADHVLLAGALLLWLRLAPGGEQGPSKRVLSNGALGIGLALLALTVGYCTAGRGTYGWWTVFHHTFVEYKAFPASETPPADIGFALSRVARSLPMFSALEPLLFSLLGVLALVVGWRQDRLRSRWGLLALTGLGAGLAHFALFPALWPRLMMPYWAVILVAVCALWGERLGGPRRAPSQPRSDQASP